MVDALNHSINLGAVLMLVAQRHVGNFRLSRLAIANDQKACSRHAFVQQLAAQSDGR